MKKESVKNMLKVDREKVKSVFKAYTAHYDSSDEKVKLKIDHTYRVADLCERIAKSRFEDGTEIQADIDLAWLLGMLHDVGRFEQLRRYDTFIDAESVDHAALGADILFIEGHIRDYLEASKEEKLIETAIRVHNMYRIPEGLDERTVLFSNILRDADKIDILKVNVEVPLEEIYNTPTEELYQSEVTQEVMDSFYEHHAVLRSLKRTPVDNVVGHISLTYELVYPESCRIMREQGYLEKLMNFPSENEKTRQQFALIRQEMHRFLDER